MNKKPIHILSPHKPKRIILPTPENLSPEELEKWQKAEDDAPEAYRQGNFLILYARQDESCMAADLNGKTVIHHLGPVEDVFALATALQNAKWKNKRIYEESFQEFSDEEFLEEGMMALEDVMSAGSPPEPEMDDIKAMFDSLRGSFLDELIKPPKKKD